VLPLISSDRRLQEAKAAFDTSIDNGMTLFDTAEVYGTAVRN
jgi:aryl-alcohol dehydrogenase-like predicted oxidoreductase